MEEFNSFIDGAGLLSCDFLGRICHGVMDIRGELEAGPDWIGH